MNNFGLRLENLREKHGYTKVEISLKLGFTQNVYGSYERGERRPSLETIVKIADIYDVSIDYLIRGKEYHGNDKHKPELKKLMELLDLFAEKGIDEPYFLQIDKWATLSSGDIEEISNHFEWVVHKALSKK